MRRDFKSLAQFCLIVALLFPFSARAEKKEIKEMDGRTLLYLGADYLTNVARDSSNWTQVDKESVINKILGKLSNDQLDVVSKSVVTGIENIGKLLVLFGAAREYWDLFHYNEENSKSPYSEKFKKYSQNAIEKFKKVRMELMQNKLRSLADELNKKGMDVLWLSKLFDGENGGTITEASLETVLSSVGAALSPFHIYNVGIDHVGDDPYGAMLAKTIPKIKGLTEFIEGISYSVSGGAIFYNIGDAESEGSNLALNAAAMKEGELKWSTPQVSMSGIRSVKQLSSMIRLNLFISPEKLKGFDIMMLDSQSVHSAGLKGNVAGLFGEGVSKIFGDFSKLFDKGERLFFLKESLLFNVGALPSDDPIPHTVLRFSVGEFAQELTKDEKLVGLTLGAQSGTLRIQMVGGSR